MISQLSHIPSEILHITDVTDPLCGPTKSPSVCTIVIHFFFCFLRAQVFWSPHWVQRSGRAHSSSCVKGTACEGTAREWLRRGVAAGNVVCEQGDSPRCGRGNDKSFRQDSYSSLLEQIFGALSLRLSLSNIWMNLFWIGNWTHSQPVFVNQRLKRYAKGMLTHPRSARYRLSRAQDVLTSWLYSRLSKASLFKYLPYSTI